MKTEQRINVAKGIHQLLLDTTSIHKTTEFEERYYLAPILTATGEDLSCTAKIANDEDGSRITMAVEDESLLPIFSVILWDDDILIFSAYKNFFSTSNYNLSGSQESLNSIPKKYFLVLQALLMELGKM